MLAPCKRKKDAQRKSKKKIHFVLTGGGLVMQCTWLACVVWSQFRIGFCERETERYPCDTLAKPATDC